MAYNFPRLSSGVYQQFNNNLAFNNIYRTLYLKCLCAFFRDLRLYIFSVDIIVAQLATSWGRRPYTSVITAIGHVARGQ